MCLTFADKAEDETEDPQVVAPEQDLHRGFLAIARNKALSALRGRSNEELDEDVAAGIEDPQDNPEVTLQNRQKAAILLNCLTKLAPSHREVIDLVYYHEKSIDEVAEITGVPQNTVKTRMFYARKRIAGLMAAQGIDRAVV